MGSNQGKRILRDILTDVTLREGSQQERDLRGVSVDQKAQLFDRLLRIGLVTTELTAFAPGEWFADGPELVARAYALHPTASLRALYFNTRGLDTLVETSAKFPSLRREGIFHTAATANYRAKNYKQGDVGEVLRKMRGFIDAFTRHGLAFDTILISTSWGEVSEEVAEDSLLDFCGELLESAARASLPVTRLTLADTVGQASAPAIRQRVVAVKNIWPNLIVRVHLHPPANVALDCVNAAIEAGTDEWEAALGGVGGSPFATDAGANLDMRVLIRAWQDRGWNHGFDLNALGQAISFLETLVRRPIPKIALS